ncbi:unnamed protein product [Nezara viridula]|uniref:Dynein axonemal assembly factor 4 n=1 Tax=Nezara viridula TaxID=85310 RepID=A0A9P0MLT9_NEZVI|nr:unnamed protein product [Nezara viridula]
MPILIKDYSWRQTNHLVIVRVPLRNIPYKKVDLFHSDLYIKVHFPPFLFECCLYEPINEDESKCTIVEGEAVFELAKNEEKVWPTLNKEVTKQEMVQIKKEAIEHAQKRTKELIEKKKDKRKERRDACIGQQIAIDTKSREIIQDKKDSEKRIAFGDVMDWKEKETDKDFLPSPLERATALIKSLKDKNEKGKSNQNDIISNGINKSEEDENSTDEESKNESEPDKSKEIWKNDEVCCRKIPKEEKWLVKQKEARRKTGFMAEDLRPEENDPIWLLEKGKGRALLQLGKPQSALTDFEDALEIHPYRNDIHNLMDRAEADIEAEKAEENAPEPPKESQEDRHSYWKRSKSYRKRRWNNIQFPYPRVRPFPRLWADLRDRDQLCDCTVESKDGKIYRWDLAKASETIRANYRRNEERDGLERLGNIKGHRLIFATAGEYFQAAFTNPLSKSHKHIMLPFSSSVVDAIMEFAYTGNVKLTVENVEELLPAADHLGMVGLIDLCSQYLHKQISPHILQLAHNAIKNRMENDNCLVETSHSYMSRPRVPYSILFAAGGWSSGAPTNLLETYDIRSYHGLVSVNNILYIIGGFDGSVHFSTVRSFNPMTKQWKDRACMNYPRCYVSCIELGGEIYAIGGYNGRSRMSSVEKYNVVLNQWDMIQPMAKQRSDAGAVAVDNKIYVAGGFNGQDVLTSVEMYDLATKQWTLIANLRTPRSGVSLCFFRGYVYAIGGFSGYQRNSTTSLTEMYDGQKWFPACPMNMNRSALAVCVCHGLPNSIDYCLLHKMIGERISAMG